MVARLTVRVDAASFCNINMTRAVPFDITSLVISTRSNKIMKEAQTGSKTTYESVGATSDKQTRHLASQAARPTEKQTDGRADEFAEGVRDVQPNLHIRHNSCMYVYVCCL